CDINKRIFAIFSIQIENKNGSTIVYDPELIKEYISPKDDVYIIPWVCEPITLNLENTDALEKQLEFINELVDSIEKCDPWVKEIFGIEGVGEGVVMYPYSECGQILRLEMSELMFKAKGALHRVVSAKKPAQVNPELASSVE